MPNALILLPRLHIEAANSTTSPLTWGFPAPSAFTGFVHALHRKYQNPDIQLDGCAIICHHFDPQIYRSGHYVNRFRLARHPMGRDGTPTGTVEEGKVHLEVSLLIGVHFGPEGDLFEEEGADLARQLSDWASTMRLAGGAIRPSRQQPPAPATYYELSDYASDNQATYRTLRRRLLPGFALIERSDLLREHLTQLRQQTPHATTLEALLDLTALHFTPTPATEEGDKVEWNSHRRAPGWLVPLPVGYTALSPLYPPGSVDNSRDNETPFRFVEALYSLGEWISPHRTDDLTTLLWYHRAEPDNGIYRTTQHPL